MSFIAVGTNHKYSPIGIRERISFSKKRLKESLVFLTQQTSFRGVVILSTCNRVEVYADCKNPDYGFSQIEDFLATYHEITKDRLTPYLYKYTDKEAINHLFNVASGLDSQVLGETQILGQVRFFYEEAKRFRLTDSLIDGVFNKAIEIGRTVRIKTKVSSGNISIGSIAINLIKKEVGELSGKKILLIGVGEVSELILRYLKQEKIRSVFVSNRTYERAVELARSIGGRIVRFERLEEELKEADIIISATSSPHTIIKKEYLMDLEKPLFIVDLALPRDVDPDVKYIKGVRLFCLDDLGFILENNLEKRIQEIPKVLEIIAQEVENLWNRLIELEPERALLP